MTSQSNVEIDVVFRRWCGLHVYTGCPEKSGPFNWILSRNPTIEGGTFSGHSVFSSPNNRSLDWCRVYRFSSQNDSVWINWLNLLPLFYKLYIQGVSKNLELNARLINTKCFPIPIVIPRRQSLLYINKGSKFFDTSYTMENHCIY